MIERRIVDFDQWNFALDKALAELDTMQALIDVLDEGEHRASLQTTLDRARARDEKSKIHRSEPLDAP